MFAMDDSNAISIIIPVYNASKSLDACVESVLSQTFSNWRLILIDDGSTDNSGSLCKKWEDADARITAISTINGGAGSARNIGIQKCITHWLTFIDADDLILPQYLSNFHSELLNSGDISIQGYKRVTFDGNSLGESKNFSSSYYNETTIPLSFELENLLDYGQTVGKLYETELIKNHGIKFTSEFRLSEDHLFFFQILPIITGIKMNTGTFYLYQEWGEGANITRQLMSHTESITRFVNLHAATESLMDRFNSMGSHSRAWIDNFIYTGGISLILQSLYNNNIDNNQRIEILTWLKSSTDYLIKRFKPKSIKGKILKMFIMILPSKTTDFILSKALGK